MVKIPGDEPCRTDTPACKRVPVTGGNAPGEGIAGSSPAGVTIEKDVVMPLPLPAIHKDFKFYKEDKVETPNRVNALLDWLGLADIVVAEQDVRPVVAAQYTCDRDYELVDIQRAGNVYKITARYRREGDGPWTKYS